MRFYYYGVVDFHLGIDALTQYEEVYSEIRGIFKLLTARIKEYPPLAHLAVK
jgi:hypothetical protein